MTKLVRRVQPEDIPDEREIKETEETEETVQVIKTSDSKSDISEESVGTVKLKCNRCENTLLVGRNLAVNLLCPQCGFNAFLSLSNFIMQSLDVEKTVMVGDIVRRGHSLTWKLR